MDGDGKVPRVAEVLEHLDDFLEHFIEPVQDAQFAQLVLQVRDHAARDLMDILRTFVFQRGADRQLLLPCLFRQARRDRPQHIEIRVRVVLASNAVMVLLYWDIGQSILEKQANEGWGSRVIDRLAADLREAFPEMKGFSPRNLKYMRAFAAAWPEREIVQASLAQLPWYHHIALLEKLDNPASRLWYAARTLEHGWSRNILALQIDAQAHRRHGKAQTNFPATLPPPDSDLAVQVF